MKNFLNIKFVIIILFTLKLTSCKAQTMPLNASEYDAPTNTYFKDLNNELDPYVGTWKATFQGKTITLVVTKELKRPYAILGKNFLKDIIIIRYEVKDSNANILQTTLPEAYLAGDRVRNLIMSLGTNLNSNNELNLVYAGGNCSVGLGEIIIKMINSTQFSWNYSPGTTVRNDIDCPPNQDYNIYLPETENLVFTKQ
ncbi:DUF6705 family protein [Epilithonimonas pallida]|uniref:DUF6705 domain-containing protein n=1 Tax=Epilithonimonas pallida TaxID=373671 RepID=A0ABY1R436_9FLAO|nr:DUF6705 family protein [Epilithonimonas pallida]SMP93679.1 hypothetical protein SAMN05421679_10542 [Epilithonimonas pallida]